MLRWEDSIRGLRMRSSSWNTPTAVKTVVPWLAATAGLAVCATTQMGQESASFGLG
jgi:hypothetical protein